VKGDVDDWMNLLLVDYIRMVGKFVFCFKGYFLIGYGGC
jgi:hypothetical protein